IGDRADRQAVGVGVADCPAVLSGDRSHVVGVVVQVHGPATENLQARGGDRGGLRDRAGDVERQVVASGDLDQVVDGQVAAGGQPDVGVVGEAAAGPLRGGLLI